MDPRKSLKGFHARTQDKALHWIHGLQPICTSHNLLHLGWDDPGRAGNTNAGTAAALQCPGT